MCITTKVPFPKLKSFLFFCTKTRALSAFTLMSSSYNSAWHREGQYTHTGTYSHTPGHTQTQTHKRTHTHTENTQPTSRIHTQQDTHIHTKMHKINL